MNYLYLTLIILGSAGQTIATKPFTTRTGGKSVAYFSLLKSGAALIFFLITSQTLHFEIGIVPYAIGFAVSYAFATLFVVRAISCGSMTLTSLITSYSLMIPSLYGLIFLHDPIRPGFFPGLAALLVSLLLINLPDKNSRISLRWLIAVALAFLGNGMCSVTQKMQQVAFNGNYKNEFMILALAIVMAVMLVITLVSERQHIKTATRAGWYLPLICGGMNGAVNLFVMILSALMPVSVMFPSISAGSLVITYAFSRLVYKEKLTKLQFIGFLLGIASVILLNL